MAEEELEEWVRERLESGMSPERLKKSLENTGHDPGIVDRVQDPFQEGDEQDVTEDVFEPGEELEPADDGDSPSGFLDSVSMPGISVPRIPSRWPVLAAVLVLALGGGAFVYFGFPGSALDSIGSSLGFAIGSAGPCPDIGVRINSVNTDNGRTVADVLVTNGGGRVSLEVYRGAQITGSTTRVVSGEDTMVVEATGDRAVLRPEGCNEFRDTAEIG